jgi:hypothetical protein
VGCCGPSGRCAAQAIIDRVDEIVHFGLPAQPERELLLKQFYRQCAN